MDVSDVVDHLNPRLRSIFDIVQEEVAAAHRAEGIALSGTSATVRSR
jgi:hypothetical protein